ncbi:DUF2255 family protein [Nocardia blacklockiae]|uniref:DUF2255 family protein n=1 Tax=Nocardia blacklockiae TaxID=480036 RepID=UPI0018930925|nr:DUF2255 family protein [Nocardia blacklockiae]MBF6171515.1 DUF2255 family protein [Nocardia blacklockiae]
MAKWTADELTRIAETEELQLAAAGRDGTLRMPVTIWVVRHGRDLYVRSVNGPDSTWFRAARDSGRGRIRAGSIDRNVTFADADHTLDDAVDGEYATKYQRYAASIIAEITSAKARSTTLRLLPRD